MRPESECVILSRDTGFDPLVRHVQTRGQTCRRVTTLDSAFPGWETKAPPEHFSRLLTLLKKEKARPAKRKGLAGKVKSWFPALTDVDRQELVDRLFKDRHIRESAGSLEYAL